MTQFDFVFSFHIGIIKLETIQIHALSQTPQNRVGPRWVMSDPCCQIRLKVPVHKINRELVAFEHFNKSSCNSCILLQLVSSSPSVLHHHAWHYTHCTISSIPVKSALSAAHVSFPPPISTCISQASKCLL